MGFSVIVFCGAGLLTSLWLGGFIVYVSTTVGWGSVLFLPPTDAVSLVLGACAPVFILWGLVVLVHIALARSRHDVLLTTLSQHVCRITEHVEAQMRTLMQMQAKSEQTTDIMNIKLALKDLNSHVALLAERSGVVGTDEINSLWKRVEAGDLWAFAQVFLVRSAAYPDFTSLLATRVASDSLSENAVRTFNRRFKSMQRLLSQQEEHRLLIPLFEEGPFAQIHVLFDRLLVELTTLCQDDTASQDVVSDADISRDHYAFDGFTKEQKGLSPNVRNEEDKESMPSSYSGQDAPHTVESGTYSGASF